MTGSGTRGSNTRRNISDDELIASIKILPEREQESGQNTLQDHYTFQNYLFIDKRDYYCINKDNICLSREMFAVAFDENTDQYEKWNGFFYPFYGAKMYESYKKILISAGKQDIDIAKRIDENLRNILIDTRLPLYEVEKCFEKWSQSSRMFEILILSEHYVKLKELPDEKRERIDFFIKKAKYSVNYGKISAMLSPDYFLGPSADMSFKIISENKPEEIGTDQGLDLYDILKETISKLLENGEDPEVVESVLTKLYAQIYNSLSFVDNLKLKTPEAIDVLNKTRCGLGLEDVVQELTFLARAMTGFPLEIKQAIYGDSAYFDGRRIILPSSVPFKTKDLAREFYIVSAVHQAGQVEFGTFDINLQELSQTKSFLEEHYATSRASK